MLLSQYTIKTPAGLSAVAEVPSNHEEEIVGLLLRSVLGTLGGLAHLKEHHRRRLFIRYISAVMVTGEDTVRRAQLIESLPSDDKSHVIEDLLNSLKDNINKKKES